MAMNIANAVSLPKLLKLADPLDLDEEDLETLEEVIERHLKLSELSVETIPGHAKIVAAITCPFYAAKVDGAACRAAQLPGTPI